MDHSGQVSAVAPELVGSSHQAASTKVTEVALTRAGALRLDAIDLLRGLVIVLMVLDHVRDYVHAPAFVFSATDLTQTNPILFMTRWVTHLCAPTFVFLSGVSIFMQRANGKAPGAEPIPADARLMADCIGIHRHRVWLQLGPAARVHAGDLGYRREHDPHGRVGTIAGDGSVGIRRDHRHRISIGGFVRRSQIIGRLGAGVVPHHAAGPDFLLAWLYSVSGDSVVRRDVPGLWARIHFPPAR